MEHKQIRKIHESRGRLHSLLEKPRIMTEQIFYTTVNTIPFFMTEKVVSKVVMSA